MHTAHHTNVVAEVLAIALIASATPAALASSGPVGQWTFNEGRGSILHDSVGSNHGTAFGTPTFVPGIEGMALSFDSASSDLVDVGNVALFDFGGGADFSISMWVKYASDTAGDQYPVSNHFITTNNGWICFAGVSGGCYGDPNRATFYVSNSCGGELTAPTPMYDGAWHHVVSVFDSGTSKAIYIDGGPIEAQGAPGGMAVHALSRLVFGGVTNTNGQALAFFNGLLDDVQIYDRVLGCGEVNFLFTHPGAQVPLIPDFDEDGDVDAADLAVLLGAWGPCRGTCAADFDCSGSVDAADLATLLGAWTS